MKAPYVRDYTPTPVVYQGMDALTTLFEIDPRLILDPCAGSGGFGTVFRKLWPRATTSAVEPRKAEAWWLSQNYDRYCTAHFDRHEVATPSFDLIAANPPFSRWIDILVASRTVLKPKGIIVLLGLTSWGSRSKEGVTLFKADPPIAQLRITATVGFHGKGQGTDTRDYCWWIWHKELSDYVFWPTFNLPRLEPEHRNWVVPPGRESAYGSDVQICGKRYLLPSPERVPSPVPRNHSPRHRKRASS